MTAMTEASNTPSQGSAFIFDEDKVEGLNVRVRPIQYEDTLDGGDGTTREAHQFMFKITPQHQDEFAQLMAGASITESYVGLPVERDGIVEANNPGKTFDKARRSHKRFALADGREALVVWYQNTGGFGQHESGPNSLHNKVQVYIFEDGKPVAQSDVGDIMGQLGIPVGYPDAAAQQRFKENAIEEIFRMPSKFNPDQRSGVQIAAEDYGITPDDVTMERVGNQIVPMLTREKGAQIAERTGTGAFHHQFTADTETGIYATDDPMVVVSMLLGEGLMSTNARWSEGIGSGGMSSATDVKTGGADYVFVRQATNRNEELGRGVDLNSEMLLRRLDWFAYTDDTYGATDTKKKQNQLANLKKKSGSRETMFKRSVPVEYWHQVRLPDDVRDQVLEELRRRNVTHINGVPIEQFVLNTTSPNFPGSGYDGAGPMPDGSGITYGAVSEAAGTVAL